MRALVAAGSALACASLALTVDNLRRLRVPDPHAAPPRERVAVLVPARDEEERMGACLRALRAAVAGWPVPAEILVLDDGSRDATAARVRELGVRVRDGVPPPPGWLAKPWACHQLAAATRADVLVFVDADVLVEPH